MIVVEENLVPIHPVSSITQQQSPNHLNKLSQG
jgi:hypothetical protein